MEMSPPLLADGISLVPSYRTSVYYLKNRFLQGLLKSLTALSDSVVVAALCNC